MLHTLKSVFGFDTFRPYQREIVEAIVSGRDCFSVMPTGGGKSLCFQMPSLMMNGTCLVISPLIALMKDQVDAARTNGIRAACINSAQSDQERIQVFGDLYNGAIDLLYISPERFTMDTFLNNLSHVPLCMAAVDEAHCISDWGHDFRPEYLYLSEIIKRFPEVPVAAFTATATHRVQNDIITRLGLRNPLTVRASFNRPNLYYRTEQKSDIEKQIAEYIINTQAGSGIVYRTTRNNVESTAEYLCKCGIRAIPYHAGLDNEIRQRNQEAFNRDEVDVVVATIAFGMGIDKPNVRFVIHGDLPKNMESYYQETGRAGRDGDKAECVLFFGWGDVPKIRYFIDKIEDTTERRRLGASLNEMVTYAQNRTICRRKKILAYFGEMAESDKCDACDICESSVLLHDATGDARLIIKIIHQTHERFGILHIIDIIRGANTKRIREQGHNELEFYGKGKEKPKKYWQGLIDEMIGQDILDRTAGNYPVVTLCVDAFRILRNERSLKTALKAETPKNAAPNARTGKPSRPVKASGGDIVLFDRLRALRRHLASEKGVPPYIIFSDRTLHDMCARMPSSLGAMSMVNGVGDVKLEMYGTIFLKEIKAHIA
ncbi:MAG: DNA helicase RecQ [Chitinivibrionales bacterium]|nr:DNA helicase RecQ [Chitinivibrionales bacterium]